MARTLAREPQAEAITSLAGRTRAAQELPGAVRVGGFGGAEGLAQYLNEAGIDLLIDATHPYASQITHNAGEAARTTGVPLLRLDRPPWREAPGDRWVHVANAEAAAAALPGLGTRVFLTTGRQELKPFAVLHGIWFLLRLVEEPAERLPLPRYSLLTARGPFTEADESALLKKHRIEVVVSKNSGGGATYAKIAAARKLNLPVVMIDRPQTPGDTEVVESVDAAMAWIARRLD